MDQAETIDISFLKDLKLAVLMGGWSSERDISLMSGEAVINSLKDLGIKSLALDLKSESDANERLNNFDLAFIALHGRGGEDGFIQKILKERKIRYTGSGPKACGIAMNKCETKKVWRELALPTPDFVEITRAGTPEMEMTPYISSESDITSLDKSFVVKPAREGSSIGITIVRPGKDSLEEAMKLASKFDETIITEAYVEGTEITVPILGQKALNPITIEPKGEFYDFDAKYYRKDTRYFESRLSSGELADLKDFSWHAFSSIGCEGWGRVDLIQDKDKNFQLIEINTVPGLTQFSLVPKSAEIEGISFNKLVVEILRIACERR